MMGSSSRPGEGLGSAGDLRHPAEEQCFYQAPLVVLGKNDALLDSP